MSEDFAMVAPCPLIMNHEEGGPVAEGLFKVTAADAKAVEASALSLQLLPGEEGILTVKFEGIIKDASVNNKEVCCCCIPYQLTCCLTGSADMGFNVKTGVNELQVTSDRIVVKTLTRTMTTMTGAGLTNEESFRVGDVAAVRVETLMDTTGGLTGCLSWCWCSSYWAKCLPCCGQASSQSVQESYLVLSFCRDGDVKDWDPPSIMSMAASFASTSSPRNYTGKIVKLRFCADDAYRAMHAILAARTAAATRKQ